MPRSNEEQSSSGERAWLINGKFFAWERPLRKSDLNALGRGAPTGAILGVRTADLEMKEAWIAQAPKRTVNGVFESQMKLNRTIPILRMFDVRKAGLHVIVEMIGVEDLHRELHSRNYGYMNPGIQTQEWGARELCVVVPSQTKSFLASGFSV